MILKTNNYCQFKAMHNEKNSTMRKKNWNKQSGWKRKKEQKGFDITKECKLLEKKMKRELYPFTNAPPVENSRTIETSFKFESASLSVNIQKASYLH